MILGLDVSTSIVGYTILEEDKVIECSYIDLRKEKHFFKKAEIVESVIKSLLEKYRINHVYIEDILQSFSGGMSSAKTITQLARFNGIVSHISFRLSGVTPVYINVNSARKLLGLKIDKNSNIDKKEQVRLWVDKKVKKSIEWPTKVLKSGPNKGNEVLNTSSYDMADSFVIALAGFKQ